MTMTTVTIILSSDLWSLGCILFQFLAGSHAFKGETTFQTFELIKQRSFSFPPGISAIAKDLIDRLLVMDPADRLGVGGYQTLKAHPFFRKIVFENLHMQTPPPTNSK
jgi:3-phosphoinositide dependent protein kinase-1